MAREIESILLDSLGRVGRATGGTDTNPMKESTDNRNSSVESLFRRAKRPYSDFEGAGPTPIGQGRESRERHPIDTGNWPGARMLDEIPLGVERGCPLLG